MSRNGNGRALFSRSEKSRPRRVLGGGQSFAYNASAGLFLPQHAESRNRPSSSQEPSSEEDESLLEDPKPSTKEQEDSLSPPAERGEHRQGHLKQLPK